jgi:hypothetical protein
MKESYECVVKTDIGPESCGATREDSDEAFTREGAGLVFSVRSFNWPIQWRILPFLGEKLIPVDDQT